MDFLTNLNNTLDYIEDNLENEIDYEEVAKQACSSVYHFQRMFSYVTGIPLAEYIRKRRLTSAAFDLTRGEEKIIDIAIKYGYDSPAAFSRAFKGMHGVSPSSARKESVSLKAYPRMSFQIEIKGDIGMNYKIENKGQIRVVGVKEEINPADGDNFKVVPKMWERVRGDGTLAILGEIADKNNTGVVGVCANFKDSGDGREHPVFDNYIGAISDKDIPKGMEEIIVPPATYAVFESIGPMPGALQETWKKIFSQWFPTSDYEFTNQPEFEYYTSGDVTSPDYYSEIWIPVEKKEKN